MEQDRLRDIARAERRRSTDSEDYAPPLQAGQIHAGQKISEQKQKKDRYWGGFATGALIGTASAVGAYMITNAVTGRRDRRVLHFEDSLQIGRPVEEVFRIWADFEELPSILEGVENVEVDGQVSTWDVIFDGRHLRWQAETVQYIPNEAIGWKSVSGPKHSGRIAFSRLGDDTLLHLSMNYAPPLGRLASLLSPAHDHIEAQISRTLREFKAAVEAGKVESGASGSGSSSGMPDARNRRGRKSLDAHQPPAAAEWRDQSEQKAESRKQEKKKQPQGVDYTRPPQARYP